MATSCILRNLLLGFLLGIATSRITDAEPTITFDCNFKVNGLQFVYLFTNRLSELTSRLQIYRLLFSLCGLIHHDVQNHKQKRKQFQFILSHQRTFSKTELLYNQSIYLAYLSILLLLLSSDVHPNPGPRAKPKWKYPCGSCSNPVRSNQRGIFCDNCKFWWHQKCAPDMTVEQYNQLGASTDLWFCPVCTSTSTTPDTSSDCDQCQNFSCNKCLSGFLPFSDCDINSTSDTDNCDITFDPDDNSFDCFSRKGLHFLHINARSLLPKISELKLLVHKTKVAVLSITETWLDSTVTDNEVALDGYSIIRKDRNRNGGGVCMYIRQDLAYNPRDDLNSDNLESVWCEILLNKTKPIIVGTVYRPPSQTNFLQFFELTLTKLRSDLEVYILGDLNICFLHKASSFCRSYINVLDLFGLTQIINSATRMTQHSASLLDHIICNQKEKICYSGVLTFGLSDHLATYCTRKIVKGQISKNVHNFVKIRSLKNYTKEIFCQKLSEIDWSSVLNCTDVNIAWDCFRNIMNNIIDVVAPLKEIRVKINTEPWMNTQWDHVTLVCVNL